MAEFSKILDLTTLKDSLPDGDVDITAKALSVNLDISEESNKVTYSTTDALIYELSTDGKYYIVEGIEEGRTAVYIPSRYNKKPVKEIAKNAFSGNKNIKNVIIPKSVKHIGANAFNGCANIENLTIEDDDIYVYFINRCLWRNVYCWYYSLSLGSSANPGDQMEKIAKDEKGYDIYRVKIPSDITVMMFGGESGTTGEMLFSETILPSDITNHSVWVLDYLVTQSTAAEKTTDYTPDTSEYDLTIGESAFASCSGITTFHIPNSIKSIGNQAFWRTGISNLSFGENCRVEEIQAYAFNGIKITELTLPKSLKTIGIGAFGNCTELTTINIPINLQTIGDGAFAACEKLTTVDMSKARMLRNIGESAFYECYELRSIVIQKNVTYIGANAFTDSGLTAAYFDDVFGWYTVNLTTGARTPLDYLNLEEGQGEIVAYLLKNGATADCDWYKLDQMNPPELILEGDILTITDPIGFAEQFKIFANGKNVHTIKLGDYNNR